MKFKTVGAKNAMIALDENGKKVWYHTYQKVYEGAKQYLKEGDEVEIKLAEEEKGGLKVITFIKKIGQSTPKPQPSNTGKPTCEDCGAELKDSKYKKCWKCNQKAQNDTTVKNLSSDTPKCTECGKALKDSKYTKCFACNQKNLVKKEDSFDGELSKRQTVAHATSRVLIALQGQLDLNNVTAAYSTIYNHILELIDKK